MANIDLYDESRQGFLISTAIKQAWAAQLQVLFAIEEICNRHNIDYYADWGTLLASVRHGGYIPWDDDLDICMKREDYEKFRSVADSELPSSFAIHDYNRQDDHWLFIAKVVNCNHMTFEKEHLDGYSNFPYIACVDIFILDYLYDDPDKEQQRRDEILRLLAIADGIVDGDITGASRDRLLQEIGDKYSVSIDLDWHHDKYCYCVGSDEAVDYEAASRKYIGKQLYGLVEKQMARVREGESHRIGQIFPWVLKGFAGYPKEYYGKPVRIPFENHTISVPPAYDGVLSRKYGDYLRVVKGVSAHSYPFYEGQKNALPVAGSEVDKLLHKYVIDAGNLNIYGADRHFADIIEVCQNYGGLIDSEKLSQMGNGIDGRVSVFLYCGRDGYNSIRQLVDMELALGSTVYVKKLALYRKDIYRNIVGKMEPDADNDCDAMLSELNSGSNKQIFELDDVAQLVKLQPNIIVTNYVYDGCNPCVTIDPAYYSDKLVNYTDKLIFVQSAGIDDFEREDNCQLYNYAQVCANPIMLNASEIVLFSKCMKERLLQVWEEHIRSNIAPDILENPSAYDSYVEEMLSIIGDKITIMELHEEDAEVNASVLGGRSADGEIDTQIDRAREGRKKKLLYCIGLSELAECVSDADRDDFLNRVTDRIAIFEASRDKIDVDVILFPSDIAQWKQIDEETLARLIEILNAQESSGLFSLKDEITSDVGARYYDAYYGAPSPAVSAFMHEKKPVMISSKV